MGLPGIALSGDLGPHRQRLLFGQPAVGAARLAAAARRAAACPATSGSSRIVLAVTSTAAMVLLIVLLLTSAALAQGASAQGASSPGATARPASPPTPSEGEADKIYRVLFPVDDEQQPAEPYVYVPQDFSNRLGREAASGGNVPQQWVIVGAEYRIVFDRDTAGPALQARELVALYRVRTNLAGMRLVLPIRQDQVYLLPNRARLDGRPASVAWEAEGTRLVVEVPEAGEADLELAFRPQVERGDGMLRCEVLIPRVPTARVRLQVPDHVSDVDCPAALAPQRRTRKEIASLRWAPPIGWCFNGRPNRRPPAALRRWKASC